MSGSGGSAQFGPKPSYRLRTPVPRPWRRKGGLGVVASTGLKRPVTSHSSRSDSDPSDFKIVSRLRARSLH